MTESPSPIVDAELHAYVDGELDAVRRVEVEAHLRRNPEAAALVEAYKLQNERLHAVFDALIDEPLPESLTATLARTHGQRSWRVPLRVAAAVCLFVAGIGSGWWLRGPQPMADNQIQRFTDNAVAAHQVFTADIRHPVEVAASEQDHLVAWLSKRLGQPLRAPKLSVLGFDLVGGRLLPAPHGLAAAQFMYEDTNGRRLTLYIRSSGEMEATAFRFIRAENASMFYWIDKPLAFALIGNVERDQLQRVSHAVYEQIVPTTISD